MENDKMEMEITELKVKGYNLSEKPTTESSGRPKAELMELLRGFNIEHDHFVHAYEGRKEVFYFKLKNKQTYNNAH